MNLKLFYSYAWADKAGAKVKKLLLFLQKSYDVLALSQQRLLQGTLRQRNYITYATSSAQHKSHRRDVTKKKCITNATKDVPVNCKIIPPV